MKIIILLVSLLSFYQTLCQTEFDKLKAKEFAIEGIELMNEKDNFESIYLLKKAEKLDPSNFAYPYEIGVAYNLQGDYKKAVKYLKKSTKMDSCQAQCFLYLATIQKQNEALDQAIHTYKNGISKLKNEGELYLQLGITYQESNEIKAAVNTWKQGTVNAPNYASNYYATALYLCQHTTNRFYGVIDAEIFINLERETQHTDEISKLLYNSYKQSIIYEGTNSTVNLIKNNNQSITADPLPNLYKKVMDSVLRTQTTQHEFSILSFHSIRTAFIKNWYKNNFNNQAPNLLFDWHKNLESLGYFESYNYWLLRKANEKEFNQWYYYNKKKFDEFIIWFANNPLIL